MVEQQTSREGHSIPDAYRARHRVSVRRNTEKSALSRLSPSRRNRRKFSGYVLQLLELFSGPNLLVPI
ncbi:hypothetical protein L6164_001300 [Bauhinia variegata]|uniref:Uncharacterized protein n=1 Tax=Bauhinia variegata TaxID=167791 RepID=A0ACB9Q8K5_BAUVA|nr:hypothetical protein L6164_001300 [Bauhinia variegata]